ncbi:MAG: hypothetical protein ACH255_20415 [Candidatus Thiodiazotropha sp.]
MAERTSQTGVLRTYSFGADIYAYSKLTEGVTGLEALRATLGNRFRGSPRREVAAET